MLDGMKMASQGMLAMMAKQDVISNNLANINTVGYQSSSAITRSFEGEMQAKMEGYESVGGFTDGVPVIGVKTSSKFIQGSMKATGNSGDLALAGESCFFTVKAKNGDTMYTRDGNFSVDAQGNLITSNGAQVMGFNGPIRIPQGKQFEVNDRGIITVEGQEIGRLRVTEFSDLNELYKVGNAAYKSKDSTNVGTLSGNPQIKQGFLETSNVNLVGEMINMMDIEKAYESNQKVLQAEDQMLQKAISEVGRVG